VVGLRLGSVTDDGSAGSTPGLPTTQGAGGGHSRGHATTHNQQDGKEGRQVRYELADDRLAGALRELARVVLDSPACPAHLEPRP
jgi:hypothetical protein